MLTNPNTVGLFERDIAEIADIVHDAGGLLYYDGANLNALLGRGRPGDMGFDVMHYNVHKTFATPAAAAAVRALARSASSTSWPSSSPPRESGRRTKGAATSRSSRTTRSGRFTDSRATGSS